jgi:hypothetical protein
MMADMLTSRYTLGLTNWHLARAYVVRSLMG